MTAKHEQKLPPLLYAAARDAYYKATAQKSVVADLEPVLHAVGLAVLAAAKPKRAPRKKA